MKIKRLFQAMLSLPILASASHTPQLGRNQTNLPLLFEANGGKPILK